MDGGTSVPATPVGQYCGASDPQEPPTVCRISGVLVTIRLYCSAPRPPARAASASIFSWASVPRHSFARRRGPPWSRPGPAPLDKRIVTEVLGMLQHSRWRKWSGAPRGVQGGGGGASSPPTAAGIIPGKGRRDLAARRFTARIATDDGYACDSCIARRSLHAETGSPRRPRSMRRSPGQLRA